MVMGAGAMLSVFQGSQALEAVFQFQSAQPEENRQPVSWLNRGTRKPSDSCNACFIPVSAHTVYKCESLMPAELIEYADEINTMLPAQVALCTVHCSR